MNKHELFGNLAKYYDYLYSFKNYEKEASDIMTLIREAQPEAKTFLNRKFPLILLPKALN